VGRTGLPGTKVAIVPGTEPAADQPRRVSSTEETLDGHRRRLQRCAALIAELTTNLDAERELRNRAIVDARDDGAPLAKIAEWAGLRSEASVVRIIAEAG
jgi:hypothetical protein